MTVSARFRAHLSGHGTPRWRTEVGWSNDGGQTWTPATYAGGTVTCSATSQIRWTANISVLDVPFGVGGLNPYQSRFRVRHGMVFSDHEQPEWLGLGIYRTASIKRSSTDPARVELTGESFESYLIRASLIRPRTIQPAPAREVAEGLILEVLPNAQIEWDLKVNPYLLLPKLVSVTDRWGAIDGDRDARSIAKALGARVYCDGDGTWRVMPVPSLQDKPAWEAHEGPGGVSFGVSEELTNDGVTNVEIVTGTPTGSSTVIGPGIARDLDPTSLTYVGRSPDEGGYGEVPAAEYQSQMVTSRAQADMVARARLAARLGLKQRLSFDTLHDPTKLPGQVGIVHGLDQPKRCILDSVTYDLSASPGPLQCQTRTTLTRLANDAVDVPEDE